MPRVAVIGSRANARSIKKPSAKRARDAYFCPICDADPPPVPNRETIEAILEAERDAKAGRLRVFKNFAEYRKFWDSEGL